MRPPSLSDRRLHNPDGPASREDLERRRQVRGLLLLAFAAILFAIFRAGVHRVFTVGWWRLW
jgi:hypothetical protein